MEADTQAQIAFFLTGRRPEEHLDAIDGLDLRPALFAGYRELTQLRYDFPLVLVADRADAKFVQSLSGLIDDALAHTARGSEGERIRKHVLRLEQEIRTLAAGGVSPGLGHGGRDPSRSLSGEPCQDVFEHRRSRRDRRPGERWRGGGGAGGGGGGGPTGGTVG